MHSFKTALLVSTTVAVGVLLATAPGSADFLMPGSRSVYKPGWSRMPAGGFNGSSLRQEGSPSGEVHDGKGPIWDHVRRRFILGHPRLAGDAAALSGDISLVGNQWNTLASAPGGPQGFRSGMAEYPPNSDWTWFGKVVFTATTSGTQVALRVVLGDHMAGGVAQPRMQVADLTNCPIGNGGSTTNCTISGGGINSASTANKAFEVNFYAPLLQCAAPRDWACEALVQAYPDNAGVTAKGSTSLSPVNFTSNSKFFRIGGPILRRE